MTRRLTALSLSLSLSVGSALLALGGLSGRAAAEETTTAPTAEGAPDATRFLAVTLGAAAAPSATVTSAWAGYDGATGAPSFSVGTEARLVRRLSLLVGVGYGSAGATNAGVRPQVGARVQLLNQGQSGVDASATLMFRQDRFTSEDGLFQGGIAVGRSFGDTAAVVNLVYATDGEGDDHEGELRLGVTRRLRGGLHAGVEARYMHTVASTDPNRQALGTPSMEASAGPLLAYQIGSWAVIAEVGLAARQTSRLDTGVATLGGVVAAF